MIFGNNKKLASENNTLKRQNASLNEQIDILNAKLLEEKSKAENLAAENDRHLEKLALYEKQQQEQALKFDKKLVERYNAELLRLKNFIHNWQSAMPEHDKGIDGKKRMALSMALAEILKDKPCVNSIDEGVALLDKLKGAIHGNSVSESGFNLDEVLNPGNELDLESLCKELGVMD